MTSFIDDLITTKILKLNLSKDALADNLDPETNEVPVEYIYDLLQLARELRELVLYRMEYYDINNIRISDTDMKLLDDIDETINYLSSL